jgi:hypothetical protein
MKRSGWSAGVVDERLTRFAQLLARLDAVRPRIAAAQQAAFFQLVEYPLRASALANERFFALERYAATLERDPIGARAIAARAVRADRRLKALTARYNAGRWAGILAEEPADGLWTSYRQQAPLLPAPGLGGEAPDALVELTRAAADLAPLPLVESVAPLLRVTATDGWRRVPGLGRGDGVMAAQQPGATLTLEAACDRRSLAGDAGRRRQRTAVAVAARPAGRRLGPGRAGQPHGRIGHARRTRRRPAARRVRRGPARPDVRRCRAAARRVQALRRSV